MQIVCLDLEGVLVPEIWIAFSERTGIPELRRTTRDEPDYDKLMRFRLDLLRKHGLKLADIQEVIAGMGPEPGAKAFLDALRQRYQVVILSDTFYEFAMPLMAQLGMPTLFCHRLETDAAGLRGRLPPPHAGPEAGRGEGLQGARTSGSWRPATPTTTPPCSARPTPASSSGRRRTSSPSSRSSRWCSDYAGLRAEIDRASARIADRRLRRPAAGLRSAPAPSGATKARRRASAPPGLVSLRVGSPAGPVGAPLGVRYQMLAPLRPHHRVAGLALEGLGELREVGERAVDAPAGRGVRVGGGAQPGVLRADLGAPGLGVGQEELLLRA